MKTCNVSENLYKRIQGAIDGNGRRYAEEETGVGRQVREILCYAYHAFSCIP
jgi:hypothetical protein